MDRAKQLLVKAYRKNLINTLDFMEYARRIDGFYSLDIVKRLEKLLKVIK